jgi:5-methylthioribose kinase
MDIEDHDALLAYLRATRRIGPSEAPLTRVLRGGVSNRTVWLARESGEQWVLKQALARLRVQVEWLSSPERIVRESLGMQWLARLLPPGAVPQLVFEDAEHHLLAMTAVPEPHRNWKTMLLEGRLEPAHVEQFAALLAAIHAARSPDAAGVFADTSFFESLRLEPYYAYTAAQVPAAAPFLHALIEETRRTRVSLVHGDFSPKNILVHEDRLVLLDHEVIHFGDPAFDLGFSLTHLLSKAHHVSAHRRAFAEAVRAWWAGYARRSGLDLEPRAVRHTLACLLARVDGRSPLEYLNAPERERQRAAALALMPHPPRTVSELVTQFLERL